MTIPAGFGTASIRFAGDALPNGAAIVLGFQNAADEDAAKIAEDFHTVWSVNVQPLLSVVCNQLSTLVKLGPDASGPSAEFSATQAGGVGGQAVSPQMAVLVRKNTAAGGRRGRGRIYVPGAPLAYYNTGGDLNGADRDDLQDAMTLVGSILAITGYPLAVLHDGAFAPNLVTTLAVDGRWATQRRRQRD